MAEHNATPVENDDGHGGLGLAGRMAKLFIHSPLSPLLLMASVAIGILGLLVTPRQEDPQISVPMIDIFVEYPGVSSEQVASLVSRPLERLMSEISGVDNVYSAAHRGHAMVTVQFDVGNVMEDSVVKVHDRLMANRDLMPPGVSEPMVKPKGVDDVPTVTLTFWSHEIDDALLRQIALDAQQQLNEVPDTSQSFLVSGREEQLRIEPRPERLVNFGIGFDDIARAVQASNSEAATGRLESGGRSTAVHSGAFISNAEDVRNLLIGVRDGQPIYLSDVADVTYGPGEVERFVRYYTGVAGDQADVAPDGAAAVTLAIAKKSGSNGVSVTNGVLERLEVLKGQVIPDNVEVSVTRNYGESANDKVNELLFKLFIATGAVTLLVWLFLGIRAAIVVLIVIPVVLLFTVFSAWLLGYTIDRVSLFALIFAIGILVDDAIVVVENIYRRWLLKGGVDTDTTVDAVREVGNPTILATFTVIAALLPMGFVSGMMGPYMQPIPALGTVAMLFSLVAAFVFTPWLTMRLKPSFAYLEKMTDKEHKQVENLGRFFRTAIPGLADNRKRGLLFLVMIIVAFFAVTMLFATKDVRVKMLPLDNKPVFNVFINFPEGTALPETATAAHEMATILREFDEVTAIQSYVGTASPFDFNGLVRHYYLRQEPWQADLHVQLLGKGDRSRTSHQVAVEARERLTPIAEQFGAQIQVVEMPPGPPVLQAVVAEIYGPDAQTRRQVARDMEAMFHNAEHLGDVDSFLQTPHEIWHFEIDRDKALRRGISVDAVNRTLTGALQGQMLGDVKAKSLVEPHRIVLRLPNHLRADIDQLLLLPVATGDGGSVLLTELGRFERREADEPIFHKNLRPVEYVTAESIGLLAAPVYGMLEVQSQLKDYRAPDGSEVHGDWLGAPPNDGSVAFEWAGEWTVTYETFRDMGIAFAIALILIYMLVVWEFGNFVLPGIIMAPIPLTLIGIIPGHWLLNAEFTATSMIGFIALAGIIVRNSILLVDFARQAVVRGHDVQDAMIMACQARTRPILITALALLAGSSVILFDPIFQGMAISLMFGTVVATALTLLVIPLGCISGRRAFCPATLLPSGERSPICSMGPRDGYGSEPTHGYASAPTGVHSSTGTHDGTSSQPGRMGFLQVLLMLGGYLIALIISILVGLRDLILALWRMWRRRGNDSSGRGPNGPGSGGPSAGGPRSGGTGSGGPGSAGGGGTAPPAGGGSASARTSASSASSQPASAGTSSAATGSPGVSATGPVRAPGAIAPAPVGGADVAPPAVDASVAGAALPARTEASTRSAPVEAPRVVGESKSADLPPVDAPSPAPAVSPPPALAPETPSHLAAPEDSGNKAVSAASKSAPKPRAGTALAKDAKTSAVLKNAAATKPSRSTGDSDPPRSSDAPVDDAPPKGSASNARRRRGIRLK